VTQQVVSRVTIAGEKREISREGLLGIIARLYFPPLPGEPEGAAIPPTGVDVSKFGWAAAWRDSVAAARRNKQQLTPHHTLASQYRYNSLNQVVSQQSPDGGLSEFWYDRLGRLVISRNARQKGASSTENNRLYSYTKYDSIGRITEVGQVSNTSGNGAMTDDISRDPVLLDTWLATLNNRRGQITNTVYDLPYAGFDGIGDTRLVIEQKNLRNRVSYTTITDTGTSNIYSQGTFYTYKLGSERLGVCYRAYSISIFIR
jgi:hypothetical protein